MDILGSSLYIEGKYQRKDENKTKPFIIQSKLAYGKILPLQALKEPTKIVHGVISQQPLEILIERQLDKLI